MHMTRMINRKVLTAQTGSKVRVTPVVAVCAAVCVFGLLAYAHAAPGKFWRALLTASTVQGHTQRHLLLNSVRQP